MSDDRARIIDRITKLMALGDSSFEEEARTSLHKAFKLMKEHNVTLADIAGLSPSREPTEDEVTDRAAGMVIEYMREMGRNGGLKGGPARARKLSKRRKTEIAKRAGLASGEARRRKMQGG